MRHKQLPDEELSLIAEIDGESFYGTSLQSITTRGRWEEVKVAMENYTTFRMTREEVNSTLDKLLHICRNPKGDTFAEAYQNQNELVQLTIKEWRTRDDMFFGENFIMHLAALIFFKLDDDLSTGLDPAELKRRMNLLKKKGPELILVEPLRSALMSYGLSPDFTQTHLKAVLKEWILVRSKQEFLTQRILESTAS